MSIQIGPPDAGAPHVAPLGRALVDTAALDVGVVGISSGGFSQQDAANLNEHELQRGLPRSSMLVQPDPGPLTPADHIPFSAAVPARSLNRAEPTAAEDLWAHPTEDIATLVADVLGQLTKVRAAG